MYFKLIASFKSLSQFGEELRIETLERLLRTIELKSNYENFHYFSERFLCVLITVFSQRGPPFVSKKFEITLPQNLLNE